tara:strand:+ start:190 stop:525 length:336 start_codon:yes stop_codon:yes gene_type:complete
MAREIKLTEINDFFKEDVVDLVAATTLEWTARVKKATPVDTGRLRNSWQTEIEDFRGTIINNLPYAEPVCYGENLPPSWGGQYRTRQKTVAGFPELIAKELEQYIQKNFGR